jgi:beta-galactosidase
LASHLFLTEKPKVIIVRKVIPFNRGWLFAPREFSLHAPDSDFTPVTLPHSNVILPHHNFDNQEYQFISTYRKRFTLPEPLDGRRVYVDFDGAMIASTVTINGHTLGDHDGGYTPFSFDLTDYLNDGENVLQVRLDSTERPDIPPYGYIVDYLTFGGIYRDVWLRYVPEVHIADVFVRTKDVLTEKPKIEVDVKLVNQSTQSARIGLEVGVSTFMDVGVDASMEGIEVPASSEIIQTAVFDSLDGLSLILWALEKPYLYNLLVSLRVEGERADKTLVQFGIREAVFREDGFYLNGDKIKLIGLNHHQTFPYFGGAAPARLQRKDADILKYELGVNIVRTSHYPQSPHFLERCDEIGLLVFEEIPGWQFIGDNDWKALSLENVRRMIVRDRNHPSIVLWGVRINESWDDEAFYKATNALAHELDPTRQTGGVRNFRESQFLEDVFTYNDFSNTILEPNHTPYMVTEFSGHMFPTKTFDQEERQVEHALRHARIQDKQFGTPNVAGAIGWCAFDYNTHRYFGSGDSICYHGVMDIFRLPKFAAYVYESQIAPSVRPVLRPATFWTVGDTSGGGVDPLYIFSNCDEIEVYVGDDRYGRYTPDKEEFPNLPHPPFKVTGMGLGSMAGAHYQDLRVVGYVNGAAAIEQCISADGVPSALTLQADDEELNADGSDMTRLVFKIVDKYSNRMPYATSVVSFEIEGPAQLIGENPFPLVGGQAAVYVRARETPGTVKVRATTPRLNPAEVTITLR